MIKELEYHQAENLADALKLAAEFGSRKRVLAGGTDVLVRLKQGMVDESVIVDISHVSELQAVREEAGVIHIGACVTHANIAGSDLVKSHGCALAMAAGRVGGPQIRNMGTIGGNVANASPAGDTIPALTILDATVVLASVRGTRTVPILDFFTGPGRSVLCSDELVTDVYFTSTGVREHTWFRKLGSRQAMTISTANVAVYFRLDGRHRIAEARIALGSVAPTVVRAPKTEEMFRHLPPKRTWDTVRNTAQMAWKEVAPIDDLRASARYRREVVVGLLAEAACEALEVPLS